MGSKRATKVVPKQSFALLFGLGFVICLLVFVSALLSRPVPPSRRVLLLIPIAHKETRQRDDIRTAWSRLALPERWSVERRFAVCDGELLPVDWDVVVLPCVESYDTLSSKVLTMLAWAAHQQDVEFDVLVKADADVFVHPKRLLEELGKVVSGKLSSESWWWGFVHQQIRVNRDKTDKNAALDSEIWAGYPPYTVGALYAISQPLVRRLARVYESGRMMLLQNEDQTIGVVMRRLGVTPIHTNLVQQWPFCVDEMVTVHPVANHTVLAEAVFRGHSLCYFLSASNCPLCIQDAKCRPAWKKDWNCTRLVVVVVRCFVFFLFFCFFSWEHSFV
jgi:hypothetical protein